MNYLLETPRLLLREFNEMDGDAMYLLNADPDVIKYTGDPPFESPHEAQQFLIDYADYKKHGFGRWAVVEKESDQFIGWCGLKRHEDGMVDVGFRFYKEQWGKGYATESAKEVLNYGFTSLKLAEIIGRAARENVASIRVLEKLGFTYWKKAPCHGIEDAHYYKLLHPKA